MKTALALMLFVLMVGLHPAQAQQLCYIGGCNSDNDGSQMICYLDDDGACDDCYWESSHTCGGRGDTTNQSRKKADQKPPADVFPSAPKQP